MSRSACSISLLLLARASHAYSPIPSHTVAELQLHRATAVAEPYSVICEIKYSFTNRVVNIWNSLPNKVVLADSVNCFKSRLDKFLAEI